MKEGASRGEWVITGASRAGGNARVYPVRAGDRLGALKVLERRTPEAQGRFARELGVIRRLPAHQNLVRILDASPDDADEPWYVMEWVDGDHLGAARGQYIGKLEESVALVRDAAAGVQALHDTGVFHRDLKPDNILMRANGSPAVSDLGLCWLTDFSTERLTPDDRPTGAWGFRAPEHEHERVDDVTASADVFSLVKILWWLISGDYPFPSAHYQAERFDLARKFGDVRMHAVMSLMGKVIVAEPQRRSLRTVSGLSEELVAITSQLSASPTRARLFGAVAQQVAASAQRAQATAAYESRERMIEDDFPSLRKRWYDAALAVAKDGDEVSKASGSSVVWGAADQPPRRERGQVFPDCVGLRVGHVTVYVGFRFATDASTGMKVLMDAAVKVTRHGRDVSERFPFCGPLVRGLAGTESYFYRQKAKGQPPIDPGEFWTAAAEAVLPYAGV